MEMQSDQKKLLESRLEKLPEIRITKDVIADFVNLFSLEESLDIEKVLSFFHVLQKKDKEVILEHLRTKYNGSSFIENVNLIQSKSKMHDKQIRSRAARGDPQAKNLLDQAED